MDAPPSRRQRFKAAVTLTGQTMYGAARSLRVSYNHLLLVLDGTRRGSARLEAGIAAILERAMALLADDLAAIRETSATSTAATAAITTAERPVRSRRTRGTAAVRGARQSTHPTPRE